MKIYDLPLGEVPYNAIVRLMENGFDERFAPTEWKEDLKSGTPMAIVYWYPQYIDFLYEIAMSGEDHRKFLFGFNPLNFQYFEVYFKEIHNRLVRLREKSLKLNHLEETQIKNGKVRLV